MSDLTNTSHTARALRRIASKRSAPRLPPDFETVAQVAERRDELLIQLMQGDVKANELAVRLRYCQFPWPCGSGACHLCAYEARKLRIPELADLFSHSQRLSAVSLVHPRWARSAEDLGTLDFAKIRDQLRNHLNRSPLADAVVAGGIDISWNEHSGHAWDPHWQAHAYLLVDGYDATHIKHMLARFYPESATIPRPVFAREVSDILAAASYSYKSVFNRRVSYVDETGRRNTRVLSLKPAQSRQLAVFLDAQPRRSRLFGRNLTR